MEGYLVFLIPWVIHLTAVFTAPLGVACHKLTGEAGNSWNSPSPIQKKSSLSFWSLSWQASEGKVYFSLVSTCCSWMYNCFAAKTCRLLHSLYFVRRHITFSTNLGALFLPSVTKKSFPEECMRGKKSFSYLIIETSLYLLGAGIFFSDL